jgi:hypothetical protein
VIRAVPMAKSATDDRRKVFIFSSAAIIDLIYS